MISFAQPFWLFLLIPFFYFLWHVQQRSYEEAGSMKQRIWLLLRSAVLVLLVCGLAELQYKTKINQKQILYLVDVSDSITPEQLDQQLAFVNRSISRIHSPDQVGVVVFGAQAAVERFPTYPYPLHAIESQVDGSATNYSDAARLAKGVFAEDFQKNIVLLTDGGENSGRALESFRLLKNEGISIQAVYLSPPDRPEVVLENVRAPENLRLKQMFHLEAVVSSNRSMPSLIQVYRNGTLVQEGTIPLQQKRKQFIRLPQTLSAPGIYRYEVKLKPQDDYESENNSLSAWISVEGPPRILLVDENPHELQHLQTALQERGFAVDLKPVNYFPATLEEMLVYQAIVIRNIPARSIHNAMPELQRYVRDFGGGFAMLGGEKSFGPGGYFQTPVEEILPVRMELIDKKYLADVAMVIVIDKSGSMSFADRGRQKIDLADEGAARAASQLKKSDQLGVLAVDSVPKWAYPLKKLDQANDAIAAITSIRAGGGGIYVYSGLLKAYETLKQTKASVKHVILFADTADCEEKEGPQGDSSLLLAQQMLREQKITTTTIGIGQSGDVDVEFLRRLAVLGEGRFYFTNDMYTLPEIFTQESAIAQRYYITEEKFQPRVTDPNSNLTNVESLPDLLGYVATSRKQTASTPIVSHRQDPILAFWRHGFGNALAFTSDPTEKWGRLWLAWPEYQRFWAQIGRYLARDLPSANFKVSISHGTNTSTTVDDNSTIVVDALDASGKFVELADFRGVITNGSERQVLQFHQTAPGRYEAAVSAAGGLFGKIYRMQEGVIKEESVVQFPAERTREFSIDPAQARDYLSQLAERIVNDPSQLKFPAKQAQQVHPIGNVLLLWAAFLFLIDVASRKIHFGQLRFREQTKPASAVISQTHLSTLINRKQSAVPESDILAAILEKPDDQEVIKNEQVNQQPLAQTPTPSEYLTRLKEAKKRRL